jgi:hypothetical protein
MRFRSLSPLLLAGQSCVAVTPPLQLPRFQAKCKRGNALPKADDLVKLI